MAERYLFFNAQEDDSGEYDREYSAGDFADYFESVLSSGLLHTDNEPGMKVEVESGLKTVISRGKAIIKGHLYENTNDLELQHDIPNADNDRYDRIVLRLDLRKEQRYIRLFVKKGKPAENPDLPELTRNSEQYELSLARIRVRKDTSSLSNSDISDERFDEDVAGLVSSLITLPTSEYQEQWDNFMSEINEDFDAATGDFDDQLEYFESKWGEWFEDLKNSSYITEGHFDDKMGVLDELETDDKSNFVGAMNEVFTHVSDGKEQLGTAISDVSDVDVPGSPTFNQLSDLIKTVAGERKKWGEGETKYGKYQFPNTNGKSNGIKLSDLEFKPNLVIGHEKYNDEKIIVYFSVDLLGMEEKVAFTTSIDITGSTTVSHGKTTEEDDELIIESKDKTYKWIAFE